MKTAIKEDIKAATSGVTLGQLKLACLIAIVVLGVKWHFFGFSWWV